MPTARRRAYAATNPVPVVAGGIDKAWNTATQTAWDAGETTVDAAGYTVRNPIAAAREVGDFAEDAARAAWDVAQDTYGIGQMWWNQVTRIWHTPCDGKWMVYLETMLPAAGNALWLLIVPSPSEILENYLQPYSTKSGRRGSRRDDPDKRRKSKSGKTRRSWPIVPDIDGMVANRLPGAVAVKGRNAGAAQRWIFEGIDLADRVLWYYLVYDVATTFVTGWTSGMRQAEFCQQPWDHFALISGAAEQVGTPRGMYLGDNVTADNFKNAEYGNGFIDFIDGAGDDINADGRASLNVSYTRNDQQTHEVTYTFTLRAVNEQETVAQQTTGPLSFLPETTHEVALSITFENAFRVILDIDIQTDPSTEQGTAWSTPGGSMQAFANSIAPLPA